MPSLPSSSYHGYTLQILHILGQRRRHSEPRRTPRDPNVSAEQALMVQENLLNECALRHHGQVGLPTYVVRLETIPTYNPQLLAADFKPTEPPPPYEHVRTVFKDFLKIWLEKSNFCRFFGLKCILNPFLALKSFETDLFWLFGYLGYVLELKNDVFKIILLSGSIP